MKIFSLESPIVQKLSFFFDFMMINMIYILCCVPIVTIGAATAALHKVAQAIVYDTDNGIFKTFFRAFRENFKRGTAVWLVLLLAAGICGLDLYFANQMDSNAARVIALLGMVAVAMTAVSVFILVARFENTWGNHLKNALLLSLSHAPRALLALALWGGMVLLTFFSFNTMYMMVLLWLMVGFTCLSYATLWIFTPMLKKLEPAPAEEGEEIIE